MKRYVYHEPDSQGNDVKVLISEDYIIKIYWDHWVKLMKKKNKVDLIYLYSMYRYDLQDFLHYRKQCIEDFITIHWAEEV
jgi:hypothetical protein